MLHMSRVICVLALLISPALFAQTLDSVWNLASHDERLSPGALAEVYGSFPGTASVQVGGRPAAVISQSLGRVVIQIPVELTPGSTTVVLSSGGVSWAPFNITLDPYAPGLFEVFYRPVSWPSGLGVIDCHPGLPPQAAGSPPEVMTVFATGLGPTNPAVPTGAAAPATPAPVTLVKPAISVEGRSAEVLTAVQAPGKVGIYQIDFRAPSGTGDGIHAVVLSIGGKSSNTAYLPSQCILQHLGHQAGWIPGL